MKGFFLSVRFHVLLIMAGIILRVQHYLGNRSFYQDEAWRAFHCLRRSFKEIFFSQTFASDFSLDPVGFSFLEKCAVAVFGNHEFAFRFFPFLSGVSAIFVFYLFLKRAVRREAVPIALGLFVISGPLIYYSAELKQYSTELLVTLALYLFAVKGGPFGGENKRYLRLLLAGLASLFFSYSSDLMLAAVLIFFLRECFQKRGRPQWTRFFIVAAFWFSGFLIFQWPAIRQMVHGGHNMRYAGSFFLPRPLWSGVAVSWLGQSVGDVAAYALGTPFPVIGILLTAAGALRVFQRDRDCFWYLVLPGLMALAASGFHLYPFAPRFLLFLLPVIYIFTAEGLIDLVSRKKATPVFLGLALMVFVFFFPAKEALSYLTGARSTPHNREVILYLEKNRRKGDALFLNYAAQFTYWYYIGSREVGNLADSVEVFSDEILGGGPEGRRHLLLQSRTYLFDRKLFLADIIGRDNAIHSLGEGHAEWLGDHQRTWILFADAGQEAQDFLLNLLDARGVRVDQFREPDAAVYLYDLSSGGDGGKANATGWGGGPEEPPEQRTDSGTGQERPGE